MHTHVRTLTHLQPPYYVVIFSSLRTDVDDGYTETDTHLAELIKREIPDYLGIESYREANGYGISIVYFRTLEAIQAWRANPEHSAAKKRGQKEWYDHYHIRIARIEREYGSLYPAGRAAAADEG